jgi:hypothetical protein
VTNGTAEESALDLKLTDIAAGTTPVQMPIYFQHFQSSKADLFPAFPVQQSRFIPRKRRYF